MSAAPSPASAKAPLKVFFRLRLLETVSVQAAGREAWNGSAWAGNAAASWGCGGVSSRLQLLPGMVAHWQCTRAGVGRPASPMRLAR